MHPTVVNLRKKKKITLARWAKNNGFNPQHCSMVIAGKRGASEFGVAGEIIEALKGIGVWVEPENKESGGEEMTSGLLEPNPVVPRPQVQEEPQYSQITVEDIAQQMIVAGYDPQKNRLEAIYNMQQSGTPQNVIDHALEIADRTYAKQKAAAETQAAVAQRGNQK